MIEFTGLLYREGVPIVAGTDGFAGFTLASELELYVKAGLTPSEALKVATYDAAKHTKTLATKGTIEVGKLADLVLIDGNPTQSIEDLRKINFVITRGYFIHPNDIFSRISIKPFVQSTSNFQY
jgi:imidazolonepropionase-like amidohydrolase